MHNLIKCVACRGTLIGKPPAIPRSVSTSLRVLGNRYQWLAIDIVSMPSECREFLRFHIRNRRKIWIKFEPKVRHLHIVVLIWLKTAAKYDSIHTRALYSETLIMIETKTLLTCCLHNNFGLIGMRQLVLTPVPCNLLRWPHLLAKFLGLFLQQQESFANCNDNCKPKLLHSSSLRAHLNGLPRMSVAGNKWQPIFLVQALVPKTEYGQSLPSVVPHPGLIYWEETCLVGLVNQILWF